MLFRLQILFFQSIYKITQASDTPDKMTEKLFHEFDSDNDDRISWEEFREGAKKDPIIINFLHVTDDVWHVSVFFVVCILFHKICLLCKVL